MRQIDFDEGPYLMEIYGRYRLLFFKPIVKRYTELTQIDRTFEL